MLNRKFQKWGRLPVTNTGYDGMTTSLGIVWTQIHCLRRRKPCTSRCSSVSVADITNCATNPTLLHLRFLELTQHSDEHRSLNLTKSDNKIDRHELIFINESDPPADRIPSIKRNRMIGFENKIPHQNSNFIATH